MILTVTLNAAIDKRYVVENYQVGEVNRVKECAYVAGGKGLNVSKTAAIAGAEVLATGFVGGHAGAYITEAVEKQGVATDFIQVKGESRSCINIYDTVNKTQTEFLEPGVVVSEEEQRAFYLKFDQLLAKCDVVAMSGSVPKGIGTDMYPKLVAMAKAAGKKIIVDTSGALLEEAVKAKPNMVKPNIDEIRLLTGKHRKILLCSLRRNMQLFLQAVQYHLFGHAKGTSGLNNPLCKTTVHANLLSLFQTCLLSFFQACLLSRFVFRLPQLLLLIFLIVFQNTHHFHLRAVLPQKIC